ncbi:unnamed protein product [Mytilus coruscus]|uniref:Vertnin n=1 Tax=Mytilus coruscus TaxID=42192 RepID=A0A6J8C595_MYTCO|nr:unnamed protein product [Mytilus coruscus]
MDQRMEVDAKAMDNYPDDVPDTRALYPCKVSSDGNCLPSCGSVFAHKSEFKASEIRLRIVIELVQNEHLYLDNNFLLKGTTNTKSSKNLPTIYAQYSDMYLPGIHLTENIIRSIYQKEIMKIRLEKTYMGIWQIHALSSVLCTPIYSVYPKLGNPNVRQDLNRLILPREYKHKQPIYIFWTSTRSADMNNEHWVPNHFVPILPIDNIIIEDNGRKESKEKEREVKNEEKSEEESKNQENNKGESENLENSNEESENEVNNKEEFENLENSTESENLENNNEESENIENSTESEKVEKGEESAIAENKAEKSENVQKIEEKPKNVDEKEESKMKTEENPEKEESKEENEEESENVEKTEEKIKNQREKEIKVENAKQSDKESGKVENANEVGETIGNPSEIESHDCNDTNWKDVPDPSKCVGKYVVIKYDEKPYPGVVQDAGESDIYVQCMHRVGKKDNNCFFWPRTIKDKCWYEFDDVLAVIPEPTKIDGSYSHYKIDQDIWNQITDELK